MATSAGSPSTSITRRSATGCTNVDSGSGTSWAVASVDGPPRSIGRARRWGARPMSMHTLEAIRYSQVRTEERPSKRSAAFQARRIVS